MATTTTTTTIKGLNIIQKNVIKQTKSTLIGGIKMWCTLFSNSKDIASILNELNVVASLSDIKSITRMAKDKELTLKACLIVLPNIDGVIIRFVPLSKKYNDEKTNSEKGLNRGTNWIEANVVVGNEFKPFGFAPVEQLDGTGKFLSTINEEGKFTKVAVRQNSFSVELIAKCVAKYIATSTPE